MTLRGLAVALVVLLAAACSSPPPPPRPTPIPTPSQNAPAVTGEDPGDVEDAFTSEVEDTIEQVEYLAGAPCDRLADAARSDPNLLPRIRQYAAILKQTAEHDQTLVGLTVQRALGDLDAALRQLDRTLASCNLA